MNEDEKKKEEALMYVSLEAPLRRRTTTLDLAFAFGSSRLPGRGLVFLGLAIVMHGAVTLAFRSAPSAAEPQVMVTEVELPPPPEPEKVKPPDPPKEADPVEPTTATSQPPPQAARAGALLTAKENAPSQKIDDLVDFVTDPSGTSYGSGVVARGGTADRGERGATAKGIGSAAVTAAVTAPPGDGLVAAANLSRRAALNEPNACAGFYPSEAEADSGSVTLTLVVRADGVVASSSVLSEAPAKQGFGKAARACLQQKRFDPSLDRAGKPVAAATTIKVSFVR